jgi:ABC-2 type transport system permease protein
MRTFVSALRFQLRTTHRDVGNLQLLITVPLFTVIFLLIVQHADRGDLTGHAVLAPVLIAVWGMALLVSGEIIDQDRGMGTLELTVAAPASFAVLLVGRIAAITLVSLVSFLESWLVALAFGIRVTIHHPGVFVLALLATAFATAGTALIMSTVFVLTRSARTFQNSLSYPFYVLGGVLVPVALLPGWIQPFTRVVYLSWAADLLRDSLAPDPVTAVAARTAVVVALGVAGFVVGRLLLARTVDRVRRTGTLGLQ